VYIEVVFLMNKILDYAKHISWKV